MAMKIKPNRVLALLGRSVIGHTPPKGGIVIVIATPSQVQKVLVGNYTFTQFGFSMLVTRLKSTYAKNQTPAELQKCTNEINDFLKKYESIMVADFKTFT